MYLILEHLGLDISCFWICSNQIIQEGLCVTIIDIAITGKRTKEPACPADISKCSCNNKSVNTD